jgi:hypothetical protein
MSEPLKISVRELLKLHTALNALDGIRPSADNTVIFEFEPQVKWNLTKNAVIVERHKEEHDKAVRKLMQDRKLVSGDKVNDQNRAAILEMQALDEVAKDSPVELPGILRVKLTSLFNKRKDKDCKADVVNLIPPSVLKGMSSIIDDDLTPAAAG